MTTKIIVAGGRDFTDYSRMVKVLRTFTRDIKDLQLVNGACPDGADKLSHDYAEECGIDLAEFEADWKKHGDAAGPIRNSEMAQYGHALIAFWDMKSHGTDSMIKQARKVGIPIMIIVY